MTYLLRKRNIMNRTDVDALADLPVAELETRLADAKLRVETRAAVCYDHGRDLTSVEAEDTKRDIAEMHAIRDALAIAEHRERQYAERVGAVSAAIETRQREGGLSPLAVSAANLEILERARHEYRSVSVIEERAALTTTLMGTGVEYAANGLAAPRNLWRASGIPTTEPPEGLKGTVPKVTLPAGTTLVGEGSPHAEFDDVTPDGVTMGRTGAWSDLTSEANVSTSIAEISQAHARIVARDLDLALVSKLEGSDSGLTVDEALLTVADVAAVDVSQLWVVGPVADMAALVGGSVFTPASGPDVESYATRYNGAAVYVSSAASAITVFSPSGFRCFATRLASGVLVDPKTGTQTFGQWLLWGCGQSLTDAALTVGGGSV